MDHGWILDHRRHRELGVLGDELVGDVGVEEGGQIRTNVNGLHARTLTLLAEKLPVGRGASALLGRRPATPATTRPMTPGRRVGETTGMPDEQVDANADIVIDCADPEKLAKFWAAALGYRLVGFGDPYFLLLPARRAFPPVILQRVPEPKHGKARIHFDLRTPDVDAEVRRLEALGTRRIDVGQGTDVEWVPMADPDGNEFKVLSSGQAGLS